MHLIKLSQSVLSLSLASTLITVPAIACSTQKVASHNNATATQASPQSLVEIAASDPSFSTLVTAIKAAGLVDVLNGNTNLTVFAPTNEAFDALPEGTVENLLRPENKETLIKILTYHVVPGKLAARNLSTGAFPTVEGQRVNVKLNGGKVSVNQANVLQADINANNGVIHVINQVLIPTNL